MSRIIKSELVEKYNHASNKLVLLDYDGTLVELASVPDKARPSKHLLGILIKLAAKPQTKVIIISGRSYQDIDKLFGHLPIDIIAEHGAMIKEKGIWKTQITDNGFWKKTVAPLLSQATSTCPGSFIEEKPFSLVWHYRNTESGCIHSRELIHSLDDFIKSFNLKILDGNKVVEILNDEIGKGKAARKIVEQNNYDYILSIGDDTTDEEMFEYFLNNTKAITVKVGNRSTFAKYSLNNVSNVIALLEQLTC